MIIDYGRIHRLPVKIVIPMLFTAAVFATIGRIIIRIRYQRRLFADDYVLLFGCFSLIAAFTLVNVMSGSLSFDMALYLGPTDALPEGSVFRSFETRILLLQKLCYSCEVALWVTIFAVKMSYLLFFRHLIKRMKSHMTYWKVALCIVVVSGIFCIGSIFIICSYFGVAARQCVQAQGFRKTIVVSQVTNALNMLTDLLIIAIPISLLRKMNIRLQQKIILGIFLCLSVFMFAICLVRAVCQTTNGYVKKILDVQWNLFWHIVEASVAVTVVSLTAFRSLYGIKTLQNKKKRHQPWLSSFQKNLFNRRKQHEVDELGNSILIESSGLPSIPGATLTGIRTKIDGMTTELT